MYKFGRLTHDTIDGTVTEYGAFDINTEDKKLIIAQFESPCCITYNSEDKIRKFEILKPEFVFYCSGLIINGYVDDVPICLIISDEFKRKSYLEFMKKHINVLEWKASMKYLKCDTIEQYVDLIISKEESPSK